MRTAVITTGGLGSRLLTYTKVNPKTMLPVYVRSKENPYPILRPLIENIFENLYDVGFRKFCIIVGGKTKFSIIHHMTPDIGYVNLLKKRRVPEDIRFIKALNRLYEKIRNSKIQWISQVSPMGFGHALLSASKFVGNDTFLLHAGDAYFPSYRFLREFIKTHENIEDISATILLQCKKSVKGYGIAKIRKQNSMDLVLKVEEKPKKPFSNLAIIPVYIFKPNIFEALKTTSRGHNRELQVTDAISTLLEWNQKVIGFNYGIRKWFDIGTPENYFNALKYSFTKNFR